MAKQKVIKNNKFKNAFKIAAAALCAAAIVAIVWQEWQRHYR